MKVPPGTRGDNPVGQNRQSVTTVRTDGPYEWPVRMVRTDRPHGPSVRTVRTDRPYGPSVRIVRTVRLAEGSTKNLRVSKPRTANNEKQFKLEQTRIANGAKS